MVGRCEALLLDLQRIQLIAVSPIIAAQSSFLGAMDTIRACGRTELFFQRFTSDQNRRPFSPGALALLARDVLEEEARPRRSRRPRAACRACV